jgi:hypothetical protein
VNCVVMRGVYFASSWRLPAYVEFSHEHDFA